MGETANRRQAMSVRMPSTASHIEPYDKLHYYLPGTPREKIAILCSSVKLFQLPASDARTPSKALWTNGLPAVTQEPQLLTEEKTKVLWSPRSLRFMLPPAHGAQDKCMVPCPLLSFHMTISHSLQLMPQKNPVWAV